MSAYLNIKSGEKYGCLHMSFSTGSDIIRAAQIYNISAMFLFGEFAGQMNDVPDPPAELIEMVETQYRKKLNTFLAVTQKRSGSFVFEG